MHNSHLDRRVPGFWIFWPPPLDLCVRENCCDHYGAALLGPYQTPRVNSHQNPQRLGTTFFFRMAQHAEICSAWASRGLGHVDWSNFGGQFPDCVDDLDEMNGTSHF